MTATLQCPQCGQDVFEADADGQFWDDWERACPECGTICRVTADGEFADVTTNDDAVLDVGQPACDGSCGAVEEFIGKPCLWTCERAKRWLAAVRHAASIPPASALRGVGYWRSEDEPDLPLASDWVNLDWDVGQRAAVIRYLQDGQPRNHYKGSSLCRFCACVNGSSDLTDGTWVWPEGYAHYLTVHGVVPPQAFLAHVLRPTKKEPGR